MAESPFASHVPLWATLRETDTTVMVTPQADYVGALELGRLHIAFAGQDTIDAVGESLRALVGSLDDEVTLHFVYRVVTGTAEADIRDYESSLSRGLSPALETHVRTAAARMRERAMRRVRIYLFFSRGALSGRLNRGVLGSILRYFRPTRLTEATHARKLAEVATLRDQLVARLASVGIGAREMDRGECQRLWFDLLNPARAAHGVTTGEIHLRDNLYDDETIARLGVELAEYTEAEQLVHEDPDFGEAGHMTLGGVYLRAVSLKSLPEGGTNYYDIERLFHGMRTEAGPIPFWLSVTVTIAPQAAKRRDLSRQHTLSESVRGLIPFFSHRSADDEAGSAAHAGSIQALFAELHALSSKVVGLSMHILVAGRDLDTLNRYSEVARTAVAAAGNAQVEE